MSPSTPQSSVEPPTRALPRRLPGIDVARGVAASAVLAFHVLLASNCEARLPEGALRRLVHEAMWMLGFWGVGLFFVLSGLCIHLPMARRLAEGGRAELEHGAYFKRRFTRIYPPHFVALMLSVLVAFALPDELVAKTFLTRPSWGQLAAHVAMVHSLVPKAVYSVNAVLWTIAIETHFYLLYPLVIAARRRVSMELIAAILFGVAIVFRLLSRRWLSGDLMEVATVSFPMRWWEWILGGVLAERLARRPPGEVGWAPVIAAMAGSFVLALAIDRFGGARSLVIPFVFAIVLYLAVRLRVSPARAIDRAMVWCGQISYSLYLAHPIILALLVHLMISEITSTALKITVGFLGCFVGSAAFFNAFERPVLRRTVAAPAPALPASAAE